MTWQQHPNYPTRREAIGLFAAGAWSLLMPATAHSASRFRFVTPFNFSLSYAPVFYGVAAGYFAKEGLDVEVVNGKGAQLALQLVVASQADICHTGAVNYIIARVNANAPLTSIATYSQISPFYLISAPSDPIRKPSDMVGKTIGVASLGGSQFGTLVNVLRAGGIDPALVNKVVVNDGPASYGLIEAKRISGYVGPVHTNVLLPNAIKMSLDDGLPSQVYLAQPQAIASNESAYVAFLRVVYRVASEMLDSKDLTPMLKIIGSKFDLVDLADKNAAIPNLKLYLDGMVAKGRANLLRNVPETWEFAVKVMAESGDIKERVDPTTLYTNRLLDKAVA
jgi:ABC-type nitrate/sulfonate/bicarbonate transport system substrate-binding protein